MEQIELFKKSFGDCGRQNKSNCTNKTSYEISHNPIFFIVDEDNNEPIKIVGENDYYQLTVLNPNKDEVCIVKTDKCLFYKKKHQRCDCILFNSTKYFLVEISSAKKSKRKEKKIEALNQFEGTIEALKEGNVDLTNFDTRAVICFKTEKEYAIQPSSMTRKADFFSANKILLTDGNKITF